jgi:hypothetical protein
MYQKTTVDALVKLDFPWSLGSLRTQRSQMNAGTLTNTGLELGVETRILDNENVAWTANLNYARNANLLKRLGRAAMTPTPGSIVRYVEGYPINGYWGRPILAYDDANQDGVIDAKEIVLSDSSMYVGSPDPKYEATLHSTITLWRNVTVATSMQYRHKFNQYNESLIDQQFSRSSNDPNTALATQALYVVAACRSFTNACNSYVLARQISVLRFNSLSVNFIVPPSLLRRVNVGRQVSLSVQGSNLGFISSYTGKDPNVSSSSDDAMRDEGVFPQARSWQLVLRF